MLLHSIRQHLCFINLILLYLLKISDFLFHFNFMSIVQLTTQLGNLLSNFSHQVNKKREEVGSCSSSYTLKVKNDREVQY
jgi:hypothetical protein